LHVCAWYLSFRNPKTFLALVEVLKKVKELVEEKKLD
jgi:hypothetical protein